MLPQLNEEEARLELSEESVHVPYHRQSRRLSGDEGPITLQDRINAARGYKAYALPTWFSLTLCSKGLTEKMKYTNAIQSSSQPACFGRRKRTCVEHVARGRWRSSPSGIISWAREGQRSCQNFSRSKSVSPNSCQSPWILFDRNHLSAQKNPLVSEEGHHRAAEQLNEIESDSLAE